MNTAKGKKRYNLHLNKENTEIIRDFIKDTGFTLSGYIDMLFRTVVQNMKNKGIKPGDDLLVREAFEILKITEYMDDHSTRAMIELIRNAPEEAIKLLENQKKIK